MTRPHTALYQTQTVPVASPAQVGTGVHRLRRVIVSGHTADAVIQFKNAATDTGDVLLTVSAPNGQTVDVDLQDVGGLYFSVGIYCKPAGTGAIAYVWFE